MKILVVDDEPAVAQRVAAFISRAGYAVESETDSRKALLRVCQDLSHYAAVITDNNMPQLTGVEMSQRMRAAGYEGKIVMFSAHTHFVDGRVGMDALLSKPADLLKLVPTVDSLLHRV